jgi:hypothetical protein
MTATILERPTQASIAETVSAAPRALVTELSARTKVLPEFTMETIELDDLRLVPDVFW